MPDILGLLRQLLSTVTGFIARTSPQLASILLTLMTLADTVIDAVTGVANSIRDEIIASLKLSIQGPDPDVTSTLPDVKHDTETIIRVVGESPGAIEEILRLVRHMYNFVPSFINPEGYVYQHPPQDVSASGFVEMPPADGVIIDVLSVPDSLGCEFAGSFRRYPHIGWLVPTWDQFGYAGDLSYLGPEHHNIAFAGIRRASGIHLFLRPGVTVRLTPWYNIITN